MTTTNAQQIPYPTPAYAPDCAACHANDFKSGPLAVPLRTPAECSIKADTGEEGFSRTWQGVAESVSPEGVLLIGTPIETNNRDRKELARVAHEEIVRLELATRNVEVD